MQLFYNPNITETTATFAFDKEDVNLPSHSGITRSDVAYVCKTIRDFFG